MTPKLTVNSFVTFAACAAILILSVAFSAPAQTTGSGQRSAKNEIVSQQHHIAPKQARRQPVPFTTGSATPVPAIKLNKRSSSTLDQENPLFLPAVGYSSGGSDAFSVAVADVNNDGIPDLAVAAFSDPAGEADPVGVLLGNGDGTFRQAVTYDSGGEWSVSVVVADVNGDGKLDLVLSDYASETVGVLLGNGDGTFQQGKAYSSGGAFPQSVAVGDVNGDGKPDLLVANCGTNTCENGLIGVLLGNGDGTFQSVVTYDSGGLWATSVAVADVNGDGKLDLLVANGASATVGVLLGNGDGSFQTPVTYNSGDSGCAQHSSVAVADVNGDGRLDLAVTNSCSSNTTGILLGKGDGTFQLAAVYGTGGIGSRSVAVGDVNRDGKPDVVVANYDSHTVGVLLGNGDGTFQSALTYGAGALSVAIADVNGDGRPDLLAAGNGAVSVLLNNGGPHVPTTTALVSSENPVQPDIPIIYTAIVTSQSTKPLTGTVTFQDQGVTIATVKVTGNQSSCTATYTKVGIHAISATYSGDFYNSGSTSSTLTEYVEQIPIPTMTVLNTSGSPSLVGQAVTFTAMVTWAHGNAPDGELVTFYDGTMPLSSVALLGGIAVYSTSSLTAGTHNIKATYAGEIRFKQSSGSVTQIVGAPTSTTLSSSLNPSLYGQKVTWTATVVTSGALPPTGTVTLTWKHFTETFTIGSAALNGSGVATFTKSNLNADTLPLTAVYKGDTNNLSSTSTVLNQVVTQTTSAASITSSLNPSTQGQAVTFTAKITSSTVTPTGFVTFSAGKTVLGTAQLNGGKAVLSISSLPVGSTKVTVTYAGDSNIAKSSASVTQIVH